jgi:hypothetical protein
MTLILWKAPVTDDPEEAKALLELYNEREDDSAFEPSEDIATVSRELLRRFPSAQNGPWADFPPEQTDRLLLLSIRWSADNAILDAVVDLAREYNLVLYDPQGPDVGVPGAPIPPPANPDLATRILGYFKILLIGVASAAVFWLGWRIEVPVLNWILMIIGGFFVSVVLFLLGILLFGPKTDSTS